MVLVMRVAWISKFFFCQLDTPILSLSRLISPAQPATDIGHRGGLGVYIGVTGKLFWWGLEWWLVGFGMGVVTVFVMVSVIETTALRAARWCSENV